MIVQDVLVRLDVAVQTVGELFVVFMRQEELDYTKRELFEFVRRLPR